MTGSGTWEDPYIIEVDEVINGATLTPTSSNRWGNVYYKINTVEDQVYKVICNFDSTVQCYLAYYNDYIVDGEVIDTGTLEGTFVADSLGWVTIQVGTNVSYTPSIPFELTVEVIAEEEITPILIATVADFNNIRNNLSGHYKQVADIDLQNAEWIPFASGNTEFTGSFDGDNYKIENLKITDNNTEYPSLFGFCYDTAVFKNMRVSGRIETSSDYAGLISGNARGLKAYNCHGEGFVKGEMHVGGLFGNAETHRTGIRKCSFKGEIIGSEWGVGGLIGTLYPWEGQPTLIKNCYSHAIVTGGNYGTGGLAGAVYVYMENCYAAGEVHIINDNSSNDAVGALVGGFYKFFNYNPIVKNSFSLISVVNNNTAEIMDINDIGWNGYNEYTFENVYTLDSMQFNNANPIVQSTGRITETEAKQRATYEALGWDFENVWKIDEGNGYPVFEFPYVQCTAFPLNKLKVNVIN